MGFGAYEAETNYLRVGGEMKAISTDKFESATSSDRLQALSRYHKRMACGTAFVSEGCLTRPGLSRRRRRLSAR